MPLPLFTSLPPRLRGQSIESSSPDLFQKSIVRSWLDAGFSPVSVNTVLEHARNPGLRAGIEALGVQSVTVGKPGMNSADRPGQWHEHLCTLSEFLAAIHSRCPSGTVAMVNADIGLTADALPRGLSGPATASTFRIGQRLDLSALPRAGDSPSGSMDLYGFDYLSFPAEVIPALCQLLPKNLRLGLPWWDHYVPLSLLVLGVRPRLVQPGALWHVIHDDRWLHKAFAEVGVTAARQFAVALGDQRDSSAARLWLRMYEDRFGQDHAQNWSDRLMRRLIAASLAPGSAVRNRLGVLGVCHVAMLLQAAATDRSND
jgi:hypothetical protein